MAHCNHGVGLHSVGPVRFGARYSAFLSLLGTSVVRELVEAIPFNAEPSGALLDS